MTKEFAIEYIQEECEDCPQYKHGECLSDSNCFEVKRMAIEALKQLSCEDAVSRNAVIDEIRSGQSYITKISPTGELEHLFDKENKALEDAVGRVESLPKVKPVSVIATVKFNENKLRELAEEQAQKLYDSILRCKDCKYFEYDSVAKVDGVPLIAAHEICTKWGDGCKTREDGFCYLAEARES